MKVHYLCLQATREGQASYSHVHEIVNGLRRRGCSVEIFEPAYREDHPAILTRLLAFLTVQWRLIRQGKPDVLYIRWHFATILAALWFRLRGVPVVQEVNGHYEDLFSVWPAARRIGWLFIGLSRWQLRIADGVVVVTTQLVDWARRQGVSAPVEVISNGANTELFSPAAVASVDLPPRYVVFFGALSPWQGISMLLESKAHPSWPRDVALVVVGDGSDRAQVEAAADADSAIHYLGRRPQQQLPGIVAGSLAGLIPKSNAAGHDETGLMPLKLFEILACGVPAIVTDFPGMADLVRAGDCGWVVPVESPAALAAAIAECAGGGELARARGARGRALVEQEHSWDARAAATLAFMKRLQA